MTDPGDGDEVRRPEEGLPMPRDGGRGSHREGDPARSELSAAAFDEIVAGWNAEGRVPQWPASADRPLPEAPAEPAEPPAPDGDAHFIPPEPPPLPRLGPPALVGLALLAFGLILVIAPSWIGLPRAFSLPLGLLTLACGVGWLLLRLWPAPPRSGDGDGEDDGAVL